MELFSIIDERACSISLKARSKDECIRELAHLIAKLLPEVPQDTIELTLMERETRGSTAFGEGVAIPHARLKEIDRFAVSIAVSKKGIDFESLDGKKTKLFFTILGPGTAQEDYLKILAQISRVAKNRYARDEMLKASSEIALKEAFVRYLFPREKGVEGVAAQNSKLLVITLYERRLFDDVIELLISRGIRGASIFDSTGYRSVLSKVPLFSEFIHFTGDRSERSRTIMVVVEKGQIPQLVEDIEAIVGDLEKHAGAMVLALDVHYMKGTFEVL